MKIYPISEKEALKKKYIALKDNWYDEGTEVEFIGALIETYDFDGTYSPSGLFRGIKDGKIDEEMCGFDEFDIIGVLDDKA